MKLLTAPWSAFGSGVRQHAVTTLHLDSAQGEGYVDAGGRFAGALVRWTLSLSVQAIHPVLHDAKEAFRNERDSPDRPTP